MHKKKTFLAIIPARGGSKGLPNKNIKRLCGKPLIAWSIEAGLACQFIDEVMVTTDSEEIANLARGLGAVVPFLRPVKLASDTATTFDAVKHVIDYYSTVKRQIFDYIVLLEPTSPLRERSDLDQMIEKIASLDGDYDAIVSLGEVHEHPSIMKKINGNQIEPYIQDLAIANRRQDNDPAFFPYGVGYIIKLKTLLDEKTFYPSRTIHHIIKRYQCYEIDDVYDFLAVENIMKYEWNKA
jgi:CMP-N,N'-diacetyllegionaminic acid synthase